MGFIQFVCYIYDYCFEDICYGYSVFKGFIEVYSVFIVVLSKCKVMYIEYFFQFGCKIFCVE